MTQTQLQYLNYLESVRANQAREALNARQIDETVRANTASEGIRGSELDERERAARATEALRAQELEMNAEVNAARNALFAAQTDAAVLENVHKRLYDFDDHLALANYLDQFHSDLPDLALEPTIKELETYYQVTRPSNYVQRTIGGEDVGSADKLLSLVTKLVGMLTK